MTRSKLGTHVLLDNTAGSLAINTDPYQPTAGGTLNADPTVLAEAATWSLTNVADVVTLAVTDSGGGDGTLLDDRPSYIMVEFEGYSGTQRHTLLATAPGTNGPYVGTIAPRPRKQTETPEVPQADPDYQTFTEYLTHTYDAEATEACTVLAATSSSVLEATGWTITNDTAVDGTPATFVLNGGFINTITEDQLSLTFTITGGTFDGSVHVVSHPLHQGRMTASTIGNWYNDFIKSFDGMSEDVYIVPGTRTQYSYARFEVGIHDASTQVVVTVT
ncbi:MAG: hypothetical protein DRQ54_08390 [Gammaproteobacteria bacterium]|nr:MAG: hypothetical protein DRQ54_08390 [Gammaproteobacteria bacterium]